MIIVIRHRFHFIVIALLSLFCTLPAFAENNVKASLVSDANHIIAGQPLKVGIKLEAGDWHTYYKEPGDSGLPTTLSWTLPDGFVAGGIEWPEPQKFTEESLITFGYTGTTTLPVTIKTPSNLTATSYELKVKANWLACKQICIPESAELSINLPVSGAKATDTDSKKNSPKQTVK